MGSVKITSTWPHLTGQLDRCQGDVVQCVSLIACTWRVLQACAGSARGRGVASGGAPRLPRLARLAPAPSRPPRPATGARDTSSGHAPVASARSQARGRAARKASLPHLARQSAHAGRPAPAHLVSARASAVAAQQTGRAMRCGGAGRQNVGGRRAVGAPVCIGRWALHLGTLPPLARAQPHKAQRTAAAR